MPLLSPARKKPRFRSIKVPPPHPERYHAYILQCADGSYYVSHSNDVQRSLDKHSKELGVSQSAAKRLFRLIMTEGPYPEQIAASRAKGLLEWSRSETSQNSFVEFVRMHVWLECL